MINLYQKTWKEINTEIAERMVQLRKRKKLSQKSLALRSGVSLGSLKRFEQTGGDFTLVAYKNSYST